MTQNDEPNAPRKIVFQMSEMTEDSEVMEDNEPIAPKESIFKRARFGLLSILAGVLGYLFLFLGIAFPLNQNHFTSPVFFYIMSLGFLLGGIFSLIGFRADRQKKYTYLGFFLTILLPVACCGLALFLFYQCAQAGHGTCSGI